MIHQEEISLKSLTENEDIQISYSNNDIVLVDSIQKFAELNAAHIAMNAIVFSTNGKVQARMSGKDIELCKNEISIVPQNVTITDIMVSPDFDIKALFFTGEILHSSLLEKMSLWNEKLLSILKCLEKYLKIYSKLRIASLKELSTLHVRLCIICAKKA